MEITARYRVPNDEVWFVQAVLTDCEGDAVVSLGEREQEASIISVFYDDSAREALAPLFAYLVALGKMVPVSHGDEEWRE
jgi:hypothetical protein